MSQNLIDAVDVPLLVKSLRHCIYFYNSLLLHSSIVLATRNKQLTGCIFFLYREKKNSKNERERKQNSLFLSELAILFQNHKNFGPHNKLKTHENRRLHIEELSKAIEPRYMRETEVVYEWDDERHTAN